MNKGFGLKHTTDNSVNAPSATVGTTNIHDS